MFAYAGGAALFDDVRFIFVSEVAQGGQNRVRRRLAQAAEGVGLDVIRQRLELVEVFQRALSARDFIEDLNKVLNGETDAEYRFLKKIN